MYKPSEWQKRFHGLEVREALGGGVAGCGKSTCLLMDPLMRRKGKAPGFALHMRARREMLQLSIERSKRLFPEHDPSARWDPMSLRWSFDGDFVLQFAGCEEPEQFFSYEIQWLGFDELVQIEERVYDLLSVQVRDVSGVEPVIRSMTNPTTARNKWVRKRFVDPAPSGGVVLETGSGSRIYLPAKLSDNPDKGFVRDYERQLMKAPAEIRARFLEGDWYQD